MKLPHLPRRRLLKILALTAILPALSVTDAIARFPRGGSASSVGRTVLNLGFFWSGSFPFINMMKMATDQSSSNTLFPQELTADGYPTGTLTNSIQQQMRMPTNYSGDWIIDWTGQVATGGNVGFYLTSPTSETITTVSGGAFRVGGAGAFLFLTGTDGSIRVSFSAPPAAVNVVFDTTGSFSGFTSLRVYRADQEAAQTSGEIFNPEYIAPLQALKPRVLRFLDWSQINQGNVSRYAYLPPDNAMTWGSYFWPPGARPATMTTGGSSTAYTCGNGTDHNPAAYEDGETIQLRIHTTNTTTTPTLARGVLGPKTIIAAQCYALPVNNLATNGLVTFVYSAALNAFMAWSNGESPPGTPIPHGLTIGVPLSVQVALCNKLSMDFWGLFPTYFDDTSAGSFTTYVKGGLNSGLSFWPEFSNEIWNSQFIQTSYAAAVGNAAGMPSTDARDYHYFYALRYRQIMGAVATAWSGRSTNELKRVIAFQSGNVSPCNTYRLQGTDLGAFGYNVAPNRPIDWCDVMSYATYYQGTELFSAQAAYINAGAIPNLKAAADDYDSGNPVLMAAALAWVDGAVRNGTTPGLESLADLATNVYPPWEALRAAYGKLIANYEGGYQVLAPDASTCAAIGATGYATKINTLLEAFKNNVLFYNLVTDQMNQIRAVSAGTIPAWYYFIIGSVGGQWSLYPGALGTTPYKSFDAIAAFNH